MLIKLSYSYWNATSGYHWQTRTLDLPLEFEPETMEFEWDIVESKQLMQNKQEEQPCAPNLM